MKKILLSLLLITILLSIFTMTVYAKQEGGKIEARGTISYSYQLPILKNVTFTFALKYTLNYTLSYNDRVNSGDTNSILIELKGGHITLTADFIVNNISQSISLNQPLKLGDTLKIKTTVADFAIQVKVEAPVEISGRATSLASKLTFEEEGQKTLNVKVDSAAERGEMILVRLPFILKVLFGMTSPIPTSLAEVGSMKINPDLTISFTVTKSWWDEYLIPIIIVAIVIIAAGLAFLLFRYGKSLPFIKGKKKT